ncbi:iron chelate uptake ABC transporter family permease subunit [Microbacterium amylolyticum]|uniref:Iron complex transport system permease protein n=1 Tax=Microbacterium amylolyticum TaxID=936337 RepID=A0ABS4ZGB8_9MICO|nr:iron chelate uptake ABC transporter family permease subunit [Microbacterium amylolyticum]MBP2436327.1 iron complex transport system permease protein [Microbacterium amylolyticum]
MPTETLSVVRPEESAPRPPFTRPGRVRALWARPIVRIALLGVVILALAAFYLLHDVPGSLAFAVKIRSLTIAAMVIVAIAVGTSTVVFHTITQNRILTPSIMGFDSFYGLIVTLTVFLFGTAGFLRADSVMMWLIQVGVMVSFSVFLFTWLFTGKRRSIHLMLLVGLVLGTFFRSLTEWMQRMLDPVEFQIVTDQMFASLTRPNPTLLMFTAVIVLGGVVVLVPLLRTLDVLSLGEPVAVGLGVNHRRVVMTLFFVVSVMVAASTALVGPILFFGLIVANLAYSYAGTFRHEWTLPIAVLLGILCLLGGQVVIEQLLGFQGTLSMVIEFVGGIFFLFLVLRKGAR